MSSGFILQSKRDATFFMGERYSITDGRAVTFDSASVTIRFGETDLNGIFAITALGNSISDTYLAITASAIRDISNIQIVPVPLTSGIQASQVIADTNAPRLLEYFLDMDEGLLQMSFSEVVLVSSVRYDGFTIHGADNSSVTLTSGTTNSEESKTLNITFSNEDLYALQRLPSIATNADNTFLTLTNESLTDAQNYAVISVDSPLPIDLDKFTPDTTPPSLQSFDLDINSELIRLTFDEVINGSSVIMSSIILRSADNDSSANYDLQNSFIETNLSHILQIRFNISDLNNIKANTSLATGVSNTYIQLLSGTLRDAVGNTYSAESNIVRVSTYSADTVNPELVTFDLDLNSEQLTLIFNETVDASTLFVRSITLQSSSDSSVDSYTLRSSTLEVGSEDAPEVVISLSSGDLNQIKSRPSLATNSSNAYLSILSNTIQDMVGLNVESVFPTSASPVRTFTPDTTGPSITIFSIDMNTGILTLTFNEYILQETFNVSLVGLRASRASDAESYFLTESSSITDSDGTSLTIQLSSTDLNAIKEFRSLAISSNSTFLVANLGAIRDAADNNLTAITFDVALNILFDHYVRDSNRPSLNTFDVNMNGYRRIITLHFNETIDAAFVEIANVTLHNSLTNYSLTDSEVFGGDSANLMISISETDFNELTRLRICTATTNCFLSFPNSTFSDTEVNPTIAINSSSPQSVSLFTPDATGPELVQFLSFDLDSGILELEFNETISILSINFTQLSFDTYSFVPDLRYTLVDGTVLSVDGTTLRLQLSTDDLNGLKMTAIPKVCHNMNQCNMRFTVGFIEDITGNEVRSVASTDAASSNRPLSFTPDTTQPQLSSYSLDLNTGRVELTFDEPVNPAEVVPTELTLASNSDGGLTYTLQDDGTRITLSDSTYYIFDLSTADLERIKASLTLAQGTVKYILELHFISC